MTEDRMSIVCMHVADADPEHLTEGSVMLTCETCKAPVWVSPTSVEIQLTEIPTPALMCSRCAEREVFASSEPPELAIHPLQEFDGTADIARALGGRPIEELREKDAKKKRDGRPT